MANNTTYDKIKILFNNNQELMLEKLDSSNKILSLMLKELKCDIDELKVHVKKTNGSVISNSNKIMILEEKQLNEDRRRRQLWGTISGIIIVIVAAITGYIAKLMFNHG